MFKCRLLASSGTKEGIVKLISKFYFCKENEIEISGEKVLVRGKVLSTRVVIRGKRYRFETIP